MGFEYGRSNESWQWHGFDRLSNDSVAGSHEHFLAVGILVGEGTDELSVAISLSGHAGHELCDPLVIGGARTAPRASVHAELTLERLNGEARVIGDGGDAGLGVGMAHLQECILFKRLTSLLRQRLKTEIFQGDDLNTERREHLAELDRFAGVFRRKEELHTANRSTKENTCIIIKIVYKYV